MAFVARRFGLVFRVVISGGLLLLLIPKIRWSALLQGLETMDGQWLLLSVASMGLVIVLTSWRWQKLLRVQGVHLSYIRALELGLIGQYFNAILFGTTGGDVIRTFYGIRLAPSKKVAVIFVSLMDRVIGTTSLLALGALLAYPIRSMLLGSPTTRYATGIFYGFAFLAVAAALVACSIPFLSNSQIWLRGRFLKIFPGEVGKQMWDVYLCSARDWRTNLEAVGISLLSQLASLLLALSLATALHLSPPFEFFCSIFFVVCFLIALPITVSGFGFREALFIAYLGLIRIDSDHASAFSLSFFGVTFIWSLIGGLFYLLYRHETHEPKPADHVVGEFMESVREDQPASKEAAQFSPRTDLFDERVSGFQEGE